jgi:hypothetical protein
MDLASVYILNTLPHSHFHDDSVGGDGLGAGIEPASGQGVLRSRMMRSFIAGLTALGLVWGRRERGSNAAVSSVS